MIREKTMKTVPAALLALFLSAGATVAHAHGTAVPFHGGQLAEVGNLHVEFAVRDGGVRAWVRDHADQPVAAAGKATLLLAGRKLDIALAADGAALAGEAPVRAGDKVTAVLALTVNGAPLSARFAQDAVATPPLSPQARAGQAVFAQSCAGCHGATLRGSDAGPPLLHPYYAAGGGHGDDVVLSAITKGAQSHHWKFGDMPRPEGVAAGQEHDILAFIRAMQAANGIGAAPAAADAHGGHH